MPTFVSHNEGDLIISLILNLQIDVKKVITGKNFELSHSQRKTVLEQYNLVIKSNKTEQQSE